LKDDAPTFGIGALAASAGVSVQHCRDLEAGGALPAPGRTTGGHRRYTDAHVLALVAYEALAQGHGFGRARKLLARVNEGRVDDALELVDERHATIARQRAETRAVLAMLSDPRAEYSAGRLPAQASTKQAAGLLGVSGSTLRHWEAEGLVSPPRDPRNGYRRYLRADLQQLAVVRMLRDAGYTVEQVRGVVELLGRERSERAVEVAERRLAELADASRAAIAGEVALWRYIEHVAPVAVRPVGVHILYPHV
jgi:DNA-binding transcriptional MerR regulator